MSNRNNKGVILDILSEFFMADLGNASTREWIASQISLKLENDNYDVKQSNITTQNIEQERGALEAQLIQDDAETKTRALDEIVKAQAMIESGEEPETPAGYVRMDGSVVPPKVPTVQSPVQSPVPARRPSPSEATIGENPNKVMVDKAKKLATPPTGTQKPKRDRVKPPRRANLSDEPLDKLKKDKEATSKKKKVDKKKKPTSPKGSLFGKKK